MPGDLLTSYFRATYEDVLTPSQQQQAVDSLLDFIHEVQFGTEEERLDLGVIDDEDVDPDVVSRKLTAALEKCYWQLVMFFRSSRPSSQIACAEPYLRYLLETPAVKTDPTHASEIVALLHLAGALAAPPPYRTNAHSPSDVGKISEDPSVTCFHSDDIVPTVGIVGVHYTPSRTRAAEALALFERAFALYDAIGRPYARSPSPFSASPLAPGHSALGLDVPPQPASAIAPASPTFAYCVPASPRAPLALESSPRSHRLSGLCGRRGKLPPKTELWARAAYAKLLRRLHDADGAKGHADELQRQLEIMRAYVHDHPYALPDDKYDAFLADLEREFGVHVERPTDVDVREHEQPLTRTHSRLRFAEPLAVDASPSLYPSLPPSSSCSSASSSSSTPSPQTPFTPLSPVDTFAEQFHAHHGEGAGKSAAGAGEPVVVLITSP